jgi:hypothetical protein
VSISAFVALIEPIGLCRLRNTQHVLRPGISNHHTLTKGGHEEEEDEGDPHPDGKTRKAGTGLFFGLRAGQLGLAAPTDGFIFWVPFATIGTIHGDAPSLFRCGTW